MILPDAQRFNLGYLPRLGAVANPHGIALIDTGSNSPRQLSYLELDERLERMASLFVGLGAQPGDRVALLVGSRMEFVEAMYGAYRAGLVPVSLNPRLGRDALRAMLDAATPRFMVLDSKLNDAALELSAGKVEHRITLDETDGCISYERGLSEADVERHRPVETESSSLAELAFTSGSTGEPKGVMLSHRALLLKYYLFGNAIGALVGPPVHALVHLPIFHANGRLAVGIAFQTGGYAVIQPKFEPQKVLDAIPEYDINYLFSVSAAYLRMIDAAADTGAREFPSLRFLFVGSGPSSAETLSRAEQLFAARMLQAYGSTEGGTVILQRPEEVYSKESCGQVFAGNEIRLLAPRTGGEGDYGELWIRSESMSDGYWNRPELTSERFIDGWYRSGDLFERDQRGHMYWRGRADDLMVVGGENLYPGEVERLLESHPAVLAATVVAAPHPSKGEVPVAMIVPNQGAKITGAELVQYCLSEGPAFAHPRAILVVEEFPVGPTGKVDRVQVLQRLKAAAAGTLAG